MCLISISRSSFHAPLDLLDQGCYFSALITNDSSGSETEVGCFLQRFKVQLSRDQTRSRIGTAVSTWRWLWLASIYKAYEDCVQECLSLRSWLLSPEVLSPVSSVFYFSSLSRVFFPEAHPSALQHKRFLHVRHTSNKAKFLMKAWLGILTFITIVAAKENKSAAYTLQ